MCDLLWKYCKNIVYVTTFSLLIHRFHNFFFSIFGNGIATIAKTFFFFYIFGNAIATIAKTNFFFFHFRQWHCHNCQNIFLFFFIFIVFTFLAMPLPQLPKQFFFFFFTFSAMALPQLPKFIFYYYFFYIFGNAIATINFSQIFWTNNN